MGMHQDKDERSDAPVVSLSIGDTCMFRFGNTENRGQPYTDIELRSGDLFVFGGPSRFAYHGVPKVCGPGPATRDRVSGRLNITTRVTGRRRRPCPRMNVRWGRTVRQVPALGRCGGIRSPGALLS